MDTLAKRIEYVCYRASYQTGPVTVRLIGDNTLAVNEPLRFGYTQRTYQNRWCVVRNK